MELITQQGSVGSIILANLILILLIVNFRYHLHDVAQLSLWQVNGVKICFLPANSDNSIVPVGIVSYINDLYLL